jgi:flagellar basal body P-ring protein FlgI
MEKLKISQLNPGKGEVQPVAYSTADAEVCTLGPADRSSGRDRLPSNLSSMENAVIAIAAAEIVISTADAIGYLDNDSFRTKVSKCQKSRN